MANWCDVVCETRWGAPGARRKACESGSGREFPARWVARFPGGMVWCNLRGGGAGAAPARWPPGYFRSGPAVGTSSRDVSAKRYLRRIWGSVPLSRVPSTAFGSYLREFSREGTIPAREDLEHLVSILDLLFFSRVECFIRTRPPFFSLACASSLESPTASQGASSTRRPLAAKFHPRPFPSHDTRSDSPIVSQGFAFTRRPLLSRGRSSPHPRPTRRLALSDLTLSPPSTPNSTPP